MGDIIEFRPRTALPENFFGTLREEEIRKLMAISHLYGIHPAAFYHELKDEDSNRPTIVGNLHGLLTNKNVKKMLLGTKRTGVFSREGSESPQKRFYEAMRLLTAEIVDNFVTLQDFSGIQRFSSYWANLQRYERKGANATPTSRNLQRSLRDLMSEFRGDFARLQMVPFLYGSVAWGDADEDSDIDIIFPYCGDREPKEKGERVKLIGAVDDLMGDSFGSHGIDDPDQRELLVYLPDVNAVLTDIFLGDTTSVWDYALDIKPIHPSEVFYSHHLLLEGIPLVRGLGEVDEQLVDVQEKLMKAAEKDPFFEFVMAYKIFGSLEKRVDHLE